MATSDARLLAVRTPEASADARPNIGRAPTYYPRITEQVEVIGRLHYDFRTVPVWTFGGPKDT